MRKNFANILTLTMCVAMPLVAGMTTTAQEEPQLIVQKVAGLKEQAPVAHEKPDEAVDTIPASVARGDQAEWEATPCSLPHVCLARIYLHEASGLSRPDERLIYHVLSRVGGGRVTMRAMTRYSKRATGRRPPTTPRTAWIARMYEHSARPSNYADATQWSVVEERWRATLNRAREDLRAPPEPPTCALRVDHWGGRNIDDRTDDGWFESGCVDTLNRGWCDPSLGECVPTE